MMHRLDVMYDGEVFRPDEPIDLAPNKRYVITVHDRLDDAAGDVWEVLDALTGSVSAPVDWSAEHDHYLYGTEKARNDDSK